MAGALNSLPAPPDGFVLDGQPPAQGASALPSPPDGFTLDPTPVPRPQPDTAGANRTFSRVLGDALVKSQAALHAGDGTAVGSGADALQTVGDLASVYAPIEAALNAGTGLLFGFPAYIGGAIGGLVDKYALHEDVDPKELAETMQKVFTYQPLTQRGQRLTGNLMLPLSKLQDMSAWAGHRATDLTVRMGGSVDTSAAVGAVTDATLQMVAPALFGELARKMGGQTVTSQDMSNAARTVAGPDATPAQVQAAEDSMHAIYQRTGIGPFQTAADAQANPQMRAELLDPKVDIPAAYKEFEEQPAPVAKPTPGDGLPLLDTSGPTLAERSAAVEDFVNEVRQRAPEVNDPAVLNRPEPQTLEAAGLQDTPEDRVDAALAARALATDPEAFEAAAAAHVDDDAAFVQAVKGIISDAENKDAEAGGSSAQHEPAATATEPGANPGGGSAAPGADDGAGLAAEHPYDAADETVELHAGLNPAAAIKALGDSYSPFVGVEQKPPPTRPATASAEYKPSALGDALRKIFAPASRGPLAEQQAGIMRANLGKMARQQELALEKLKTIAADFDSMPRADNIAFIDAMERGQELPTKKLTRYASELRGLLDAKRNEVQALGTGALENFDENYFPHIWKQQDEARSLFTRRPLEGSKAFLKARTIPTTVDGMRWRAYDADGDFTQSFATEAEAKAAAGEEGRVGAPLTPITTNPVELALLKAREMDRYVYGQRIFQEMQDTGLAKFVRFGARAPDGWTKIDDKIARAMSPSDTGGMVLHGEYYAPDEAATLINNHLSPGLQGNAFFDAWRGIGSAMNSAQLGLSLFHVGFTTMDSMISRVALGVKQLARGDVGEGLTSMAVGASPAQPFLNIVKGDRLLRAYLGRLDDPSMAPIVEAIEQAGGRVKMDDFYRNTTVNAFKQAIRGNDWPGAAKAFLPTVLDRISAPIFEELVPRQKLGVYFDMAKDWLQANPEATVEEKRAGLGKLWDSVDNRMGQLVYDNVFWNRALKDGLMATVRSVGWNLGTFRELGGGVLDLKEIARGKAMTDRTAYVVALPLVAGVYGAVLNYAMTGEPPQSLKDAFFPRTGRTRTDGSEDRVSLPTYMKDVYAYGADAANFAQYGSDPTQTLRNKATPLIAVIGDMLSNQDYFGGAIRNPADPAVQQIADEAKFIASNLEPFSVSNYQQQAKTRNEEPTLGGYLTSPSMFGIAPAPGYIAQSPEQRESAQIGRLRDPLMKKFRQEIRDGKDPDELVHEMVRSGLTRAEIRAVMHSSQQTGPRRLRSFGEDDSQTQ